MEIVNLKKEKDTMQKEFEELKGELDIVKRDREGGMWEIDTLENEIRILKIESDFE